MALNTPARNLKTAQTVNWSVRPIAAVATAIAIRQARINTRGDAGSQAADNAPAR